MIIQTLKIHNIASIEDAEIDFNKSPLADDPLFLITGETGSGKTTILNAICLALYNHVPALKTIGTSETDKDGLQTDNPRQLLRRGTGEGEIELTFIGNDTKHYRALWRVQRAHKKVNGKYQSIVRQITVDDGGSSEISYTKTDEIKSCILSATGLTFEQFTRTTLLAQGQFATFMKASNNEKSEILEKLTGTEIYTLIGQRVYEHLQRKTDEFKAIDNQIQGVTLLGEEEKEAMRQKTATLAAQIERLNDILKTLETQIAWLKENAKTEATLAKKKEELQKAEEALATEEYIRKRKTLADWLATSDIRDIMAERDAEAKVRKALEKEFGSLNALFVSIVNGMAWQQEQLRQMDERKSELEAWLETERQRCNMYANIGQIKFLAKNVAKLLADSNNLLTEKKQTETERGKSRQMEATAQQAVKTASDKFAAQDTKVKEKEETLKSVDIAAINKKVEDLAERMKKAEDGIRLVRQWKEAKDEWEEAVRLLNTSTEEQAASQKSLNEQKAKLPALKETYLAKRNYAEGQKQLNDHIRELRQRFSASGVCPLCGSQWTPLHEDDELARFLTVSKREEEEAKGQLDKTLETIATTEASLKSLAGTIGSRKKQENTKRLKKETAEETVKNAIADYANENVIAQLEETVRTLDKQKHTAQQALNDAIALNTDLQKARKQLETLRREKEKAERKLYEQAQRTSQLEQQAKAIDKALDNAKDSADKAFTEMTQLMDTETVVSKETAMAASLDIENRAKEYDSRQKETQRLAAQRDKLHSQIANNQAALERTKDCFKQTFTVRPVKMEGITTAIQQLNSEVGRYNGRIEQATNRINELNSKAENYFAQQDTYDRDAVKTLSQLSHNEIENYKQFVEAANNRQTEASTVVRTLQEQWEAHQKVRPQMERDIAEEQLEETKNNKTSELNASQNELVSTTTLLKQDKERANALAEKCKQREQLRNEKNNWEALDRLFGGSDGKKFRNIAQSYVLRALLNNANHYLSMLNNRYGLDCDDGSLTINVVDRHQGNAVRNVGLLSGGESFVVSLALALGLSSISGANLNVDTLFIDEGFGTLSSDYLETVIDTLDRLHQQGGMRVGIISHVEGLKERIPTQIRLIRTGPSSSKVCVVSL